MLRNGLLAALVSALATTTALAHHPFMDEFGSSQGVPRRVEGRSGR